MDIFGNDNTPQTFLTESKNAKITIDKPKHDLKILNERKAKSKTKSVKKRAQPPVKERYNTT